MTVFITRNEEIKQRAVQEILIPPWPSTPNTTKDPMINILDIQDLLSKKNFSAYVEIHKDRECYDKDGISIGKLDVIFLSKKDETGDELNEYIIGDNDIEGRIDGFIKRWFTITAPPALLGELNALL